MVGGKPRLNFWPILLAHSNVQLNISRWESSWLQSYLNPGLWMSWQWALVIGELTDCERTSEVVAASTGFPLKVLKPSRVYLPLTLEMATQLRPIGWSQLWITSIWYNNTNCNALNCFINNWEGGGGLFQEYQRWNISLNSSLLRQLKFELISLWKDSKSRLNGSWSV